MTYKCERLCTGESAFNLAIWQVSLLDGHGAVTRVGVLGGIVTATCGRMTSIVWETL